MTARIALLDRDEMQPGESVLAQVHLDSPLVAHRQDKMDGESAPSVAPPSAGKS